MHTISIFAHSIKLSSSLVRSLDGFFKKINSLGIYILHNTHGRMDIIYTVVKSGKKKDRMVKLQVSN